jgi:four helix bundle protein
MGTEKENFYKRLYDYALAIIHFVEKLPKDLVSQTIGRQLIRSGTSVVANISEAKAASSRKDYINFYTHSLKSANESKLWISLLKDSEKIKEGVSELLQETTEIANILGASIITMKKNKV